MSTQLNREQKMAADLIGLPVMDNKACEYCGVNLRRIYPVEDPACSECMEKIGADLVDAAVVAVVASKPKETPLSEYEECEYCDGQGFHRTFDTVNDSVESIICLTCGGTGVLP